MQAVAATPEWLALGKSVVQVILSRDTLMVPSEDIVLGALKIWSAGAEESTSRRAGYVELVCDPSVGIRLPYVSKEVLVALDKEEREMPQQGQTDIIKLVHEELVRRVMDNPASIKPRMYGSSTSAVFKAQPVVIFDPLNLKGLKKATKHQLCV